VLDQQLTRGSGFIPYPVAMEWLLVSCGYHLGRVIQLLRAGEGIFWDFVWNFLGFRVARSMYDYKAEKPGAIRLEQASQRVISQLQGRIYRLHVLLWYLRNTSKVVSWSDPMRIITLIRT